MKRTACFALSAVLAFSCLTACGKDSSECAGSQFLGKWQSTRMIVEDKEMSDFFGLPINALIHITFNADGSCSMASPIDPKESQTGKWTDGGDKVTVKIGDDTKVYELKGEELVAADKDTSGEVHLAKTDEFATFDFNEWREKMSESIGSLSINGINRN